MSFLNKIKSLFSSGAEGKLGEVMESIINQVKPMLESGKLGEAVKSAVENYGDLGEKLSAVMGKIGGATAEAKTGLVKEKDDILAQIKEKGAALLEAAAKEKELPESIKALCKQAEELLGKL